MRSPLRTTIILGLLLRVVCILLFTDIHSDYYWEYGEIAKNVVAGKGFALHSIEGNIPVRRYSEASHPLPTAYMSPGYVWVLIPLIALHNVELANILLILLQTLVSLITMILIFHFASRIFTPRIGLFSALAAALLPDFAYAVVSFSPTVLYHLGVISLFTLLYNEKEKFSARNLFSVALLCTVLTYFRFEFILYVIILACFLALDRRVKEGGIVLAVTILLLIPWSVRNYESFGEVVPLGTGAGLNLFRGNNAEEIGSWGNASTNEALLKIPRDRRFEIVLDSLFRKEALNFVRRNPVAEAKNVTLKTCQLWFFSSLRPTPYNALYILTSVFASLFFVLGVVKTWSWQTHKYLYLYLIYSTFLAMVFFALPRHQTMMRIGMIPFIGAGIEVVWEYIRHKSRSYTA